jgi:MFS family permease
MKPLRGAQLAQIYSLSSFFSIPFAFFGGWLSDKLGRLLTIFFTILVTMFGSLVMIFFSEGNVLQGVYIMSVTADTVIAISFWALIMENSTTRHRGLFFALVMGIKGIFYNFSTELGVSFLNQIDFLPTVKIGVIIFLVASGLFVWLIVWEKIDRDFLSEPVNEKFIPQNGAKHTSIINALKWIIVISVVCQLGFGIANLNGLQNLRNTSDFLGLEFKQDALLIDAQFAYNGTILMLGIMLLFGWLSDKFGERPILAFAVFGIGIGGTLPFLIRQGFLSLEIQILSAGFCSIAISPGLNSVLSKLIPREKLGIGYGMFTAISGIGFYLLLALQDFISEKPQSVAISAIIAFLISGILIWLKLPVSPVEQGNEMMMAG